MYEQFMGDFTYRDSASRQVQFISPCEKPRVDPAPGTNVLKPFTFTTKGAKVIFLVFTRAMLKITTEEYRRRSFRAWGSTSRTRRSW